MNRLTPSPSRSHGASSSSSQESVPEPSPSLSPETWRGKELPPEQHLDPVLRTDKLTPADLAKIANDALEHMTQAGERAAGAPVMDPQQVTQPDLRAVFTAALAGDQHLGVPVSALVGAAIHALAHQS